MDPNQQQLLLSYGGAGDPLYIDDVFNTNVWAGTSGSLAVNNGIDLAGEGGLVWMKMRSTAYQHGWYDTERGVTKELSSDSFAGEGTEANGITAFNSNGWTTGSRQNQTAQCGAWTFRKAPGFFDIVTYAGAGGVQTVSHNLGCIPGCIMIKRYSSAGNSWAVYHRGTDSNAPEDYKLTLNTTEARADHAMWNDTLPTATEFTVNDSDVNGVGGNYIAYLFAGGDSTAATARSVDFDGSGDYLVTNTSSDYDFGTGDFTVEHWIRPDDFTTAQIIDARATGNSSNNFCTYITTDYTYRFFSEGSDRITSRAKLASGVWSHVAIVRSSGTTTLYINGISQGTYSDTHDYDDNRIVMGIHGPDLSSYPFHGQLSNVRIVKGTAVYTSSFKPSTKPLTNITNTKLLCCNNSSITGTTTGTVTSGGNPTAWTVSPFDDPEGFKFGEEGDQNIIKTGSYMGNGNNDGPEVDLGWEPQYILFKNANDGGQNWRMFDYMRGTPTGDIANGYDCKGLFPNLNNAEINLGKRIDFTARGFKILSNNAAINSIYNDIIYIAIRRPDGLVSKPAEVGTDVFAMDYGNASTTIPSYDSGFRVGFGVEKRPGQSISWWVSSRLCGGTYLRFDTNTTESNGTDYTWDSNVGYVSASWADTNTLAYMWKRGIGMDVVPYTGTGVVTDVPHSLGKPPRMIWIKNRFNGQTAYDWSCRVFNGSVNLGQFLAINSTTGVSGGRTSWNPTAETFTLGTSWEDNRSTYGYVAYLFTDVEGISKIGEYTGDGTDNNSLAVTLGFSPRWVMIKRTNGNGNWLVIDTKRGFTKYLRMSSDAAQSTQTFITATATGFTLNEDDSDVNASGSNYLYYAHA